MYEELKKASRLASNVITFAIPVKRLKKGGLLGLGLGAKGKKSDGVEESESNRERVKGKKGRRE